MSSWQDGNSINLRAFCLYLSQCNRIYPLLFLIEKDRRRSWLILDVYWFSYLQFRVEKTGKVYGFNEQMSWTQFWV